MEPISAIVGALSVGAAALASGTLSEAGKDAYNRLRGAILRIVSPAELEKLEQKPNSENRKAVLAEELMLLSIRWPPHPAPAPDSSPVAPARRAV